MSETPSETRVIKVAVLVTADVGPKQLSRMLDFAFEDADEVLQFVVEGYGCSDIAAVTEETLIRALADDVGFRLVSPK